MHAPTERPRILAATAPEGRSGMTAPKNGTTLATFLVEIESFPSLRKEFREALRRSLSILAPPTTSIVAYAPVYVPIAADASISILFVMGSEVVEAAGSGGGADDDIRIAIGRYSLRTCNPVLELIYAHDAEAKNIHLKEVKLSGLPGSTSTLSAVQADVDHLQEFAAAVFRAKRG